jgi:hypothetical protein
VAFGCKDPSLTYLNKYGYNVVKLPRTGIDPLLVLGRDTGLTSIGTIGTVWKTPGPAPQPGPARPAASVEGQQTEKLDLSIGLKLLANALAAFGATTPSVDFAYRKAAKVQFNLVNVVSVSIDPFVVGEYLATGDLNLNNPFVQRYFDDDASRAYIITEVLKSDSVSVTATDSSGTEVKVDVPAISGVVGASVSVSPSSEGSATITYKGSEAVTFGFKAFEIIYANGRWAVEGVGPAAAMAFAAEEGGAPAAPLGVVFNAGGLVRL